MICLSKNGSRLRKTQQYLQMVGKPTKVCLMRVSFGIGLTTAITLWNLAQRCSYEYYGRLVAASSLFIAYFITIFLSHLGQWHCVKRTLPECSNYKLESHLPVYIWKLRCDAMGKDYFWELLRLLHKHQETFFSSVDDSLSVWLMFFG